MHRPKTLIELVVGQWPPVRGKALGSGIEFQRASPSWHACGIPVAGANVMHLEAVDGIPAIHIGRRTRNLLNPEYAPFANVPALWRAMPQVSLEGAGLSFDQGGVRIEAKSSAVCLPLPPVTVHPADEVPLPGTAQLGALYQFSAYLRGTGRAALTLRDTRNNVQAEKTIQLAAACQRPCVALDGPFAERTLVPALTLEGGTAFVDGLLLEPYVVTHRSAGRAALVPAAGSWVPGSQRRDRDRLVLPIAAGALPRAGMVDFWFRPTWHALHPHHTFFQMCHWFFAFELRTAGPEFYAGQKACPWMYYWEWGLAQGYRPDTWHHYAVVWREEGSATMYFDGQSRAHIEQARPHAFDPALAGSRLAIGGPLDEGMSLDPNVPAQLDAYLARWRLQAGEVTPHDVLVALEETDPRPRARDIPAQALFLVQGERALIDRAQEHCWFVHNLFKSGPALYTAVGRSDDTGASPNRRQNTSTRPCLMESRDRGRTWQPNAMAFKREGSRLSDGRRVTFPFLLTGQPLSGEAQIEEPGGGTRTVTMTFDVGQVANLPHDLALCQLLACRDGSFLFFAYTSFPKEGGDSVIVFRSGDLCHWQALARPYRPDGLTESGPNETAAVQFPGGRILALMRTGGWNQMLAKGFSDDGGRTWSPMLPSGICGIQPRLHLARDGVLYLVTGRPGIVLAASTDGGETFDACACAEDDRIHEFSSEFGWYGYSSMNNGLVVDEEACEAFVSYDMVGERVAGDGASWNACYVRPWSIRHVREYRAAVAEALPPDAPAIGREGGWLAVPGVLAVTTQTGAALCGPFRGTGLVGVLETSPQAGRAVIQVDDGAPRTIPLYYPDRRVQRLLLAAGLPAGAHRFRLGLESGADPQHKFANPEMPMLGGLQTVYLAGVDATRRLAVYGFEVIA
ncbi:MAG: hypothetical protein ABSE73_16720 [Planctomycetota bacterium]